MAREGHVFFSFSKFFTNLTTTTLLCSLTKKMVDPFGYASVQDPDLSPDSKPDLSKDQVHNKLFGSVAMRTKRLRKAPLRYKD